MTKKKRELIDLMFDSGMTPETWPKKAVYAAQDKDTLTWGKNALMFYTDYKVPHVNEGRNSFEGEKIGDKIELPDLCRKWNKTIVHRDEFMKRWNERNNTVTNATTPPAQQEAHAEETKPIQQERKATYTQIDKIITERGSNYGRFEDGAEIMQQLKLIAHTSKGWERMKPIQREGMDMILHKIGRILNGDPSCVDSWIDIEGYSKLVSDWLKGESK